MGNMAKLSELEGTQRLELHWSLGLLHKPVNFTRAGQVFHPSTLRVNYLDPGSKLNSSNPYDLSAITSHTGKIASENNPPFTVCKNPSYDIYHVVKVLMHVSKAK